MTPRDHLREWLSRTLKQRRLDLDPSYENLAEFSRVTGIHYKTLIRIESPKGNHRFAATTLLRLDAAYQYEPGSLEAALATGRPPRPLPTRDDTTASSGPLPSGSLERLPVVRLAAPPRGPRRRRHPHRRMATPHRLLGPAHPRPPRLLHVVGDPRRPCRDDQGRPPPPHGGGARAAPAPPGTNPHRGVPKTVTESNQTPGGVVNLRECRHRGKSATALFSPHHQL